MRMSALYQRRRSSRRAAAARDKSREKKIETETFFGWNLHVQPYSSCRCNSSIRLVMMQITQFPSQKLIRFRNITKVSGYRWWFHAHFSYVFLLLHPWFYCWLLRVHFISYFCVVAFNTKEQITTSVTSHKHSQHNSEECHKAKHYPTLLAALSYD